ncbi:hypothetical protein MLD38_019104 [Melastoma candidum]|uniref:Uncharacterized protein n=1 Tax=Melastoma candidum TaxID=119954 RepID=A0ACB9QVX8_9MYRT|nr:hypothetical protein MLD38_019104 [Melastoma candidum]
MVVCLKPGHLALIMASVLLPLLRAQGITVGITYVEDAVASGGVCLDGSPPAYFFDKGSGEGIDSWLVFLEGGAWCNNVATCLVRSATRLGSSKAMVKEMAFPGILSSQREINPDFYNWNRIHVGYCDGASFTGDIEAVDPAFLSGCSAGGLSAILKCDKFRSLLPSSTKVKCLGDAGFFINAKDISGNQYIRKFYSQVVTTHIRNILAPSVADPLGLWHNCKVDIKNCSADQLKTMQDFRLEFINAINQLGSSSTIGWFIDSCFMHCQSSRWETSTKGMAIAKAVGDWYYERSRFQEIDCPYPYNPTCGNHTLESQQKHEEELYGFTFEE